MFNLVGNALKFTKEGKIEISASINKVKPSLENEGFLIEFKVEDTGMGIKEEDQTKLFSLFGKLKQSESVNTSGVGLGLTICKNLT